MPRVTVLIPTFNWATVLPYSIGSVLDQTFTDFELFVVGDGCTDESEAVVTAIDDSRVHWRNLPANVGHQSGPNNAAIAEASGEVIAYLGHDDLWLPRHLELLVGEIDRGAAIAHGSTLRVLLDRRPEQHPAAGWTYRPGTWLPPTSFVHLRSAIVDVGGWRAPAQTGICAPEADLLQRMAEMVGPPQWVPRFTNVKLSASKRRDVYRTRPCHEQAYWLNRIREAADPEAMVAATRDEPYLYASERSPLVRRVEHAVHRLRVNVPTRLRRAGVLPRKPPLTADERIRRDREYKGL